MLDRAFIAEHTQGFGLLTKDLYTTEWADVERAPGLPRISLEHVARLYRKARCTNVAFGMGIA